MAENFYRGKKILVTGHTGFKGSWLVLWLKKLGAEIIGVSLAPTDELCAFNAMGCSNLCIDLRQDINHYEQLKSIIVQNEPEIIFHLAAQPLVLESYKTPLETLQTNIIGTANLLEACRNVSSIKAIVIITTDKCYENNEWVYGYRENDRLGGKDPYSASKAAAEIVVNAYKHSFFGNNGSPAIATVRAGNVIGGGDWADNRIVPDCVRALKNNKAIEIRNPFAVRPWQHVLEPLGGYIRLAEKMVDDKKKFSQAWNFGPASDGVKTVQDLVEVVLGTWGVGEWKNTSDGQKPHEAGLLTLDISKARNILEWQPKFSFVESVAMTIDWYKAQLSGKNMFEFSMKQLEFYENK